MNADPVWRDTIMDYETKLAEEREYGEEKGILSAIKKIIYRNRSYGVSAVSYTHLTLPTICSV